MRSSHKDSDFVLEFCTDPKKKMPKANTTSSLVQTNLEKPKTTQYYLKMILQNQTSFKDPLVKANLLGAFSL